MSGRSGRSERSRRDRNASDVFSTTISIYRGKNSFQWLRCCHLSRDEALFIKCWQDEEAKPMVVGRISNPYRFVYIHVYI